MARNDRVSRVLGIIKVLENERFGLTLDDLKKALNRSFDGDGKKGTERGYKWSERTLRRDLQAIQLAGLPLETETNDGKTIWKIERLAIASSGKTGLPTIQMEWSEAFALFVLKESISGLKGSPLFCELTAFLKRVETALDIKGQKVMHEFRRYVQFDPGPLWHHGIKQEILDTIHNACHEGCFLEVTYRASSGSSAGEIKKRRLGPECLYFYDAALYLIAWDVETKKHKTYSVARVVEATMFPDEEYKSKDFSLDKYLDGALGILSSGELVNIEILVKEPMASYVAERRWHKSQTCRVVPEGLLLNLTVRLNDEVVRWVLSLGPSATVVAPKELRDSVMDFSAKVFSIYGSVSKLKQTA